jgi:nucleotide-binding universal stress UspA family protein
MELVILNIGRELGVITDAVFAMMVIMALVTTALTTPVLHFVYPERAFGPALAPARAAVRKLFSILIPVSDPASGAPLLSLASALARRDDHEPRLLALHLRPPVDRDAYRAGLDEINEPDATLEPLLLEAHRRGLEIEPISLTSTEVSEDIAAVARVRQVDLVLMGFHRPVIGHAILGGTVHRVMNSAPADVGIFVNRGIDQPPKKLLVPYLGGAHDRLALEIAGRLGKSTAGQITVLHVVPPNRDTAAQSIGAKKAVDRVFAEPGQESPVQFKVVEDDSPVDAILAMATNFDLVVIGVGEEWGLASQLFGFRRQRIAEDCPISLLIVRKHNSDA